MGHSILLNATTEQSPICVHCIGIGKTGADMVDHMLRRGEIEDLLADPRAMFTSLAVDIGDKELFKPKAAAKGLLQRLEERNIPTDRVQARTFGIRIPEKEDLLVSLRRYREYMKVEYPPMYWNPNFEPWITEEDEMPREGDHICRKMAKSIYGDAYYNGGMKAELEEFARSVKSCKLPSTVYVFFGVGGGTGSGIVVDLARQLSNFFLGRLIPVVGFGVLPCTGDAKCHNGANLFVALNELDCMIDSTKNAGVVGIWGEPQRDPWTGGLFLIPQEQAYERVKYHTDNATFAGHACADHREESKLVSANRWIDEAVTNFIVMDYGRTFHRSVRAGIVGGSPSQRTPCEDRSWYVLAPFKEVSPGISIVKNQGAAPFREEVKKWVERIPDHIGLRKGFKTDYIDAYNYMPRDIYNDEIHEATRAVLATMLVEGPESNMALSYDSAYDVNTCWTMLVIPGVARQDLACFFPSRDEYDELDWEERINLHSWLLEQGVMLCEPSIRYPGTAGECIWGCACHLAIPFSRIRGDDEIAVSRKVIWSKYLSGTRTEATP